MTIRLQEVHPSLVHLPLALVPIAIGHEASIVLVAVAVVALGLLADTHALHVGAGVALIAFGIFRFWKPRAHFRWTKLRVNRRELGWWSFLMSTAHGAGLMVLPVVLGSAAAAPHCAMHNAGSSAWSPLTATAIHSAGYLAVSTLIALVVFEKLGVGLLRKTWVNLDLIWAAALVAASIATLATA